MIRKKIKYLSLFLILMSAGKEICFASGKGSVYIQMPSAKDLLSGGISTSDEENPDPYTYGNGPVNIGKGRYTYKYIQELGTVTDIILDVYDMNGNLVEFNQNTSFKAGTWMGINLKEVHYTEWSVTDFVYEEKMKEYTCKYERDVASTCNWSTQSSSWSPICKEETWSGSNCSGVECRRKIVGTKIIGPNEIYKCAIQIKKCTKPSTNKKTLTILKQYNETYSCPKKYPYDNRYELVDSKVNKTKTRPVTDLNVINTLRTKAINEVYNKAKESGKYTASNMKYIYINDYPREDVLKAEDYKTIDTGRLLRKEDKGIQSKGTNKWGGMITREYEIVQEKVCINIKTSDVTYGRDCTKEEMKINNDTRVNPYTKKDETIWHYFVPLNTPSNAYFDLKIEKNDNSPAFSVKRCETYMQKHITDYKETIIPAGKDNGVFEGNYDQCKKLKNNKCSDMRLLKKAGGCRIVRSVELPITQEFYNEVEKKDGSTYFNGFNFYYKPIDINNPFPNGLTSNSLWSTWNEATKKNPNLSKSFEKKTYTTTIDADTVREYTQSNPYTSWENMYKDGRSSFIENADIIKRLVDKDSFYKLGCGPSTEKEYLDKAKKIKNPKYIEGCGSK